MKQLAHHLLLFGALFQAFRQASFENNQKTNDSKKKTSRYGLTWFDGELWAPDTVESIPLPPQQVSSGSLTPQQPHPQLSVSQPSVILQVPQKPHTQTLKGLKKHHHHQQVIQGVGQAVKGGGVHAENIHCVRSEGITLLSAVVIPPPEYTAMPIFEDAIYAGQPSADCIMRPLRDQSVRSGTPKTFAMHVNQFAKCGVRVQQGSDGKEWISVTLRFPLMTGLRLAEDEYVMIMCKPQEKIATSSHVFDLRGTSTEGRTVQKKKIFRSGPKDVACKMSLMTKTPGTNLFTTEMKSGSLLRLGQELQLRGKVREGDGWKFAALKDIVVSRVNKKSGSSSRGSPSDSHSQLLQEFQRNHQALLENFNNFDIEDNNVYNDQRTPRSNHDEAHLVFSNGCRNPIFRPIAPHHPRRELTNPLEVMFGFKAFMFQDMLDGEAVRLSAQVVACADPEDCQQVLCLDESQRDFGRRRRRSFDYSNMSPMENFTESFELTVAMEGFSKMPIVGNSVQGDEVMGRTSTEFSSCRNIIISVSVVSCIFCFATTIASAIAMASKRKHLAPEAGRKKPKRVILCQSHQQPK